MATQNVKILLRRGLREQLTSDILDTGELGFTTDTNQLFIGIDSAINEIQFDPFVNAHAIIQAWLDDYEEDEDGNVISDVPFPGLVVDEDLVIRNIPHIYTDKDGVTHNGIDIILQSLHFFTQTVTLIGDFKANVGEHLYQRRFVYSDVEADISALSANKTYKILEMKSEANDFINDAAGTVGVTYTKHKNFTVRSDYQDTNLGNNFPIPESLRAVEVILSISVADGGIVEVPETDNPERPKFEVALHEGENPFVLDAPEVDNYYHFNGDENGNRKSDFGLFKYKFAPDFYDSLHMRVWRLQPSGPEAWETINVELIDESNVEPIDEAGIFYPLAGYGNERDYAAVALTKDINFFQKVSGVWSLINSRNMLTGELFVSDSEPESPQLGDFWVSYIKRENPDWTKQSVTILDEHTYIDGVYYGDKIEKTILAVSGIEVDKPTDDLLLDDKIEEHVVVTKSSKVTYWKKIVSDDVTEWKLLGDIRSEKGNATINPNTGIHAMPETVLRKYCDKPGGYWKITLYQNEGESNELITELSEDDYDFDLTSINCNDDDETLECNITITAEGDHEDDRLEVEYFFNDEIQFSNKPPITYKNNQGEIFSPLSSRTNGDPLVEGDYYVYTDKDISGGTNLNIFQWTREFGKWPDWFEGEEYKEDEGVTYNSKSYRALADHISSFTNNPEQALPDPIWIQVDRINMLPEEFGYQCNTVPVYTDDAQAVENAPDNILLYAKPYTIENHQQLGIFELRQRDYDTSEFWYPYESYNKILSYYFTKNPINDVSDNDIAYAESITGRADFPVGQFGRARRNVEVVTENTFNQLFADQHLSAEYEYTGMRPSLYRKHLDGLDGVFLKFDKNVCTTFFVDYSLKQETENRIFLRVGQLKIINGYPHGIEEIKITDENTEIWHDTLPSGDGDTIEDYDEFSNIVFETAIQEDENGVQKNNLLIIYRQDFGSDTEISYTLKRWTM